MIWRQFKLIEIHRFMFILGLLSSTLSYSRQAGKENSAAPVWKHNKQRNQSIHTAAITGR